MTARDDLAKIDMAGLDLESITPFTRLLLEHNWPVVSLVACHLLDRRELTYAEVLRLLP
jgi:hypothetical protein